MFCSLTNPPRRSTNPRKRGSMACYSRRLRAQPSCRLPIARHWWLSTAAAWRLFKTAITTAWSPKAFWALPEKYKGRRLPAKPPPGKSTVDRCLLEAVLVGQVGLERDNEGSTTKVRLIAGREIGTRYSSPRIAGQNIALFLRKVSVIVTQVKREHLGEGKCQSNVPGRIVREIDGGTEHTRDVIRRTEPVVANFTRHIPADVLDQANAELEWRSGKFRSDRRIRAAGAGVQPARRIVHIAADRDLVLDH